VTNTFGSDTGDWQFTVGDPTPIITSVNPGAWQAGTSFTATINGIGFGTNPTLTILGLHPTDISFSVVNAGDNQITANVTVSSSASSQTVTIQVQSNGYCGSGFQPANGNSSMSLPYFLPLQPVAPTPQIQLYQQNITSTQSVIVGQQMALRAVVTLPAGVTISSQQWSTPPGTAIGGYTNASGNGPCLTSANCPIPDTGGGKVVSLPGSSGDTSSNCGTPPANTFYSCYTFYWVDAANSRQMTYTYTASTNASNSVTATFNVDGPSGVSVGPPPGQQQIQSGVNVVPPPTTTSPTTMILTNGNIGLAGVSFFASATHLPPGGVYRWVQVINSDSIRLITSQGSQICTTFASTAPDAELDNTYPYNVVTSIPPTPVTNNGANDSPSIRLVGAAGEEARSFKATMYTMWVPPVLSAPVNCPNGIACTVPVPLGSTSWNWSGDAIDTLKSQTNSGVQYLSFIKNSGNTTSPPTSFRLAIPGTDPNNSFPVWKSTVMNGPPNCH